MTLAIWLLSVPFFLWTAFGAWDLRRREPDAPCSGGLMALAYLCLIAGVAAVAIMVVEGVRAIAGVVSQPTHSPAFRPHLAYAFGAGVFAAVNLAAFRHEFGLRRLRSKTRDDS